MIPRWCGTRAAAVLSLTAAVLGACGSDDQPPAAGGGLDSGVGADATTDGSATDGAGEASGDGASDGSVGDVTADVVRGSDGGDGGDQPGDAEPPKDAADEFTLPDGGCASKTAYTNGGDGGANTCAVGERYTCQGDQYVIDCECPTALCTCTKNGTQVGANLLYGGCNACVPPQFAFMAVNCGVPY